MSVTKIILSIIVVTYGSNASSLLDELANNVNSNKRSIGPYYDTMGDYYVEEPIMETTYDQEPGILDLDYSDNNDWDSEIGDNGEIMERQLPQSGEGRLPSQDKKSQTWCKLNKIKVDLKEPGYEFFPKSYIEYDCVPYNYHGSSENTIFSSKTCAVRGRCVPIDKLIHVLKRKVTDKCWQRNRRRVKVGCRCLPIRPK